MVPDDDTKYYEEDNEILHDFIEFFYPESFPRNRGRMGDKWKDEEPYEHKVFTIGGRKWTAVSKSTYFDDYGNVPKDTRVESEVLFQQLDKANPEVVITIQTRQANRY